MFDLAEEKSIGMVRADFFEYGDSAILFPQNISVSVSDDGQTWTPLGEANTKYTPGTFMYASHMQMYVWNGSKTGISGHPGATKAYNRYMKVTFPLEQLVFIDEIDIYGQDDKTVDAIKLP